MPTPSPVALVNATGRLGAATRAISRFHIPGDEVSLLEECAERAEQAAALQGRVYTAGLSPLHRLKMTEQIASTRGFFAWLSELLPGATSITFRTGVENGTPTIVGADIQTPDGLFTLHREPGEAGAAAEEHFDTVGLLYQVNILASNLDLFGDGLLDAVPDEGEVSADQDPQVFALTGDTEYVLATDPGRLTRVAEILEQMHARLRG